MINEYLEVQEYLSGRQVNPACLYRICNLLAKWYRSQGYTSLETRDAIFKWATDKGLHIGFSVTGLVYAVYEKRETLRAEPNIPIYANERDEILRRFDTYHTKLIALAVLCYAKEHANTDGIFTMSLEALGDWIGIKRANISQRYLPILQSFEYISVVDNGSRWSNKHGNSAYSYKLTIHTGGTGEPIAVMCDNDIRALYEKVFG